MMTIRTRLTLWYSGLLTLIIVIFAVTVMTMNRISILAVVDQVIGQSAQNIAGNVRIVPVSEFGPMRLKIQPIGDNAIELPNDVWMQVWQTHDNGTAITPHLIQASEGIVEVGDMLDVGSLHANGLHLSDVRFNGVQTRVATVPIVVSNGQQMGVVQVGASISTIDQSTVALLFSMAIAGVACVLVSVGLGMWISSRLLNPIEKITQTAASIVNANDLNTRLVWDGPKDELGKLSDVFNQTMARLEHLFKVQQRFVGDVSHELRTPLTSIMGNLEIMQRYGVDSDSLDSVYREAERMSRMVNDLLLLARADNGELKIDISPIDLEGIFVEVYEQAHLLRKKRPLKIVLKETCPTYVRGNADRLKQLLLNLVNNAIKFTPDDGVITLSLTHHDQAAWIDVEDTGIGISPQDQQRIFDRFFQADNSRVHRNEQDGAGLGLSIVRWIVDAHQGRVEVSSQLNVGTRFRVILPLITATPHASLNGHAKTLA